MLVSPVSVRGSGTSVHSTVDPENAGPDLCLMLHVVYHHAENPTEVGLLVHASVSYKSSNRKSYFVEPCDRVGGNDGCFYLGFFFLLNFIPYNIFNHGSVN